MKRRMQKYYWAMLETISDIVGGTSERINKELKVGYGITTTKFMDKDEYYLYLEYTHNMFIECFEIYFDSDYYKNDGRGFVFLFDNKHNENIIQE